MSPLNTYLKEPSCGLAYPKVIGVLVVTSSRRVSPLVTLTPPSCDAVAFCSATLVPTEETETNIVVNGNKHDDAKKGGGQLIVVALVVSDATIPRHPLLVPLPTSLSSSSSSLWGGDGIADRVGLRVRAITSYHIAQQKLALENNMIGDVSGVSVVPFRFFYYVSLQRTCYKWEFRFLYKRGRISCFSYPGVRYYSTLPHVQARRCAQKAFSFHSEFWKFYQKR